MLKFYLFCISVLSLCCFTCVSSEEECAFEIDPEDKVVEVNQTNIELRCQSRPVSSGIRDSIIWQIYLRNGTFWTVTGADADVQLGRELMFMSETNSLIILQVQAYHAGVYRCRARRIIGGTCTYFSDNATVTVRGPATVEIMKGPHFSINTTERLQINGTVDGQPDPNVTLSKFENEQAILVPMDHPRIMIDFMDTILKIIVNNVQVEDSGTYRITVTNEVGGNFADFSIEAKGPDPPNISAPKVVVTGIHQSVRVSCSVQETAKVGENSEFELEWKGQNNTIVPSVPSPVYVKRDSDFNVTLIIGNFTFSEYHATCVASNVRSSSHVDTVIYVPPTPQKPTIIEDSSSGTYTVSWPHIITDVPIVMYIININEAGTDELVQSDNISALSNTEEFSFEIMNLSPGDYDVRIISVARADDTVAMSAPSLLATFSVEPGDSVPVIIIGVVVGAVGVFILIIIGILLGAFFLCFYSHRRQMNSQQQQWNSEEDKVDSAVPNTYTTLALHPGNSELPPSPSTPLISSFFSTEVDPKWEFPRENIQLKDVLHEGQFTILYKGTVKGIKERVIEVAIKSVRDDANEDDVKALVSEMETLSGLGLHPNIVSLIRVCTVGSPMYVVMEYMCHGDLLGFLRASRGHHGMYHISPGTRYQPPTLNLCSRDLLNVATKIANGMRYLADRKIVHRALCAKNVLVGPGMDIKIYNVGSFDISFENREYYMKWMAPETLFDHTTTTYSDVWSYGVTLWEIVTVGGAPYAEILPEDLYSQLHSGMRMPKPQHCAQEVYDIMWQCWLRNPTDRPHFAVIHDNLEELVESKISYLDLRQYNGFAYSQFDDGPQHLSTAL